MAQREVRSLSIVLPVFNEAPNITPVIEEIVSFLNGLDIDFEVLVVDDGSQDASWRAISRLQKASKKIRAVRHKKNRGYGASLRTGFQLATKDWLLFLDADGQFNIRDLHHLLPLVGENTIVSGIRSPRKDPLSRKIISFLYGRVYLYPLLPKAFKDVNCAFKIFPTAVAREIPLCSDGFFINAEFYRKALLTGVRVVEQPISHRKRLAGRPKGNRLSAILKVIRETPKGTL